jgi:hypothetical protein
MLKNDIIRFFWKINYIFKYFVKYFHIKYFKNRIK